jgi:hypothetical protein
MLIFLYSKLSNSSNFFINDFQDILPLGFFECVIAKSDLISLSNFYSIRKIIFFVMLYYENLTYF